MKTHESFKTLAHIHTGGYMNFNEAESRHEGVEAVRFVSKDGQVYQVSEDTLMDFLRTNSNQ